MIRIFLAVVAGCMSLSVQGQHYDTLIAIDSAHEVKAMAYPRKDMLYLYPKPTPITFLKYIPRTFGSAAKESFSKKSLRSWAVVVGSTGLLLFADQYITDGVQSLSKNIGLNSDRVYYDVITFNVGETDIDIYQAPGNLNTGIYSLGEGVPPVLIAAGLLTHGLIKNDYRSLSTASQLAQCLIAVGLTTQLMKRMAGRQTPFVATKDGGEWTPFPGFSEFNKNKAQYDAFPSGHIATMMATVVILADNYPEKRWIRPVGYSLMSLVGFSMINNGVHWASDYPLGLAVGYVFGKVTVKMNRLIRQTGKRR
jgi:membrane-associated phospholipid phosphatase